MRLRGLHVAVALSLAVACGSERIPPPSTPPPRLSEPADAIPADLDLVVRVDLKRMHDALGAAALQGLKNRAELGASAGEHALIAALDRTETLWLGMRPGLSAEATDNVLVLRGDFGKLKPEALGDDPPWRHPVDLGGDVRRYERPRPKRRAAPVRLYAAGDELWVFVSAAEIDSAERAIERRAGDRNVRAPERGVISLAARTRPLARLLVDRSPKAARLLTRAESLSGFAEIKSGELSAELSLSFEDVTAARSAADATSLLAQALREGSGPEAEIARQLRVEAVEAVLVMRLKLASESLAKLYGQSPP